MKVLRYAVAAFLAAHGIVHLIGFAGYWPLASFPDIPYKTALLAGRWEVGPIGMKFFALVWLLIVPAFALSVVGFLTGRPWWRAAMLTTTLVSMTVCVLDWAAAYRGGLINLGILTYLGLTYVRDQAHSRRALPARR